MCAINIDNLVFDNAESAPLYTSKNILVTACSQANIYIKKISLNNFVTKTPLDPVISNNFRLDLYKTIIIQHGKIIVEQIILSNSENIGFLSLVSLPSDFSESD